MEVLVGSTFGIEVAASATYVRDRPQEKISSSSSSAAACVFIKEHDAGGADPTGEGTGSDLGSPELSSESSSSIGAPGDSDDEEEEGVVSSGGSGGLASLVSIEDSLPIKLVSFSFFFFFHFLSSGSLNQVSSPVSVLILSLETTTFLGSR